jgi:hypothetical protein
LLFSTLCLLSPFVLASILFVCLFLNTLCPQESLPPLPLSPPLFVLPFMFLTLIVLCDTCPQHNFTSTLFVLNTLFPQHSMSSTLFVLNTLCPRRSFPYVLISSFLLASFVSLAVPRIFHSIALGSTHKILPFDDFIRRMLYKMITYEKSYGSRLEEMEQEKKARLQTE